MCLSKMHYPLLSTGSTEKDRKSSRQIPRKVVDWDVKRQHNKSYVLTHTFPVDRSKFYQSYHIQQYYNTYTK